MDRILISKTLKQSIKIDSCEPGSLLMMVRNSPCEGKNGETRQFIYKMIEQGTRRELLTILLDNCDYDSYILFDVREDIDIEEVIKQLNNFPKFEEIFYLPKTQF